LFDGDDSQVSDSFRAGTNSDLSWINLAADDYQVRLNHPECGWYVMGSFTINERSKRSYPDIGGTTDVCDGSEIALTASTGNTSLSWVWSKYESSAWSELDGENDALLSYSVNLDITKFKAIYIDEDGCLSQEKEIAINAVAIPTLPVITGNTSVCVNDEIQTYSLTGDATDYEWTVTNGSPSSGTGTSIEVTWDNTQNSAWKVEVRGINNGGDASCEGNYESFDVVLKKDIEYHSVGGITNVCNGDLGSITLDDSQIAHEYALYQSEILVNGTVYNGTGEALTWDNLTQLGKFGIGNNFFSFFQMVKVYLQVILRVR